MSVGVTGKSRRTSLSLWLCLVVGPVTVLAVGPLPVAGQGMPVHTPSALTMSFEQRGVRTLSMVQSRGDVTGVVFPLIVLPFAPHERLTTTVRIPLTYKRMRDPGGTSGGGYAEVITNVYGGGWEDRVVAVLKSALAGHVGSVEMQLEWHG
ncbi:MAG: hypothetical protein IH787_05075 [Nitrospirae bacterium]|nr:hypothetical protein [Nitrospirota bacterium]